MIQHLKTCKTVMAEQRSCGRADLGKPVHREEYGEKMVFKYQLGLLTAKNQNEILSHVYYIGKKYTHQATN